MKHLILLCLTLYDDYYCVMSRVGIDAQNLSVYRELFLCA